MNTTLTYAQLSTKANVANALAATALRISHERTSAAIDHRSAGRPLLADFEVMHARAWLDSAIIGYARAELARQYAYRALVANR